MEARQNIIYFLASGIFLLACQKDVQIDLPSDHESKLFIECILFPGKKPKAFISKSGPFFSPDVTPSEVFIPNAEVRLSSNGQSEELRPDSTFDYFRCRWVPFYGGTEVTEYGQRYDLTVTYNGKTYTAATTVDQPKISIDSVTYIEEFFDVYGGHDGVRVYFTDAPGLGNFYRFQMNRMIDNTRLHAHVLDVVRSDCTQGELFLVKDYGRNIFSDEGIDGQHLELLIEVSFEYLEGDTAWVFMQSLDEQSAAYYRDLDDQLQAIINPFVEPVFVDTRIEGAHGVFGSAVLSDSVLFVYPQDNP